jgi:hypothetical protein
LVQKRLVVLARQSNLLVKETNQAMKTSRILSALVITTLFCLPAFSRDLAPKGKVEQFFQTLTNRGSEKAFEALFEGTPFAQAKSKELEGMKEDFNKYLANSSLLGFERVKEQTYGQSVLKLVYILKLESRPLVWEFHFYKAKTTWSLTRVGFDEDLRRLD